MIEVEDQPDILSFQREAHEFRINGKVVHSVTKILRMAGLVQFKCSPEVLQRASRRGQIAHMIAADYDNGSPEYWAADEQQCGYATAWKDFKRLADFEPDQIEDRVFNKLLGYAGIIDRRGWINARSPRRRRLLLEIKTGIQEDHHGDQLAGYALCLPDGLKDQRAAVYLRPNGSFKLIHYDHPEHVSNFYAALKIATLRVERNVYSDDENFNEIIGSLEPYEGPGSYIEKGKALLDSLGPGWR